MNGLFRPGWPRRAGLRLSPVLFGAALLAFLLPFATVSCATPRGYGSAGGGVTATYRGVTLALGGQPELSAPENSRAALIPTAEDYVAPRAFAVGALTLTIAGLVSSLLTFGRTRGRPLWPAMFGAGAAVFTVLTLLDFDRTRTGRIVERLQLNQPEALARVDPAKFVNPNLGFWALLALLLLGAALNGALAVTGRRRRVTSAEPAESPVSIPTTSAPAQNAA